VKRVLFLGVKILKSLPSGMAHTFSRPSSSPHLARTFHHLFPVRPFEELDEAEVISRKEKIDAGKEIETNFEMTNGNKKDLKALPITSSTAFTPASSISSSNVATFMVVSSSSNAMDAQPSGQEQGSKLINIGPSIVANCADCDRCCFGCLKVIGCRPVKATITEKREEEGEAILRFQCPDCHNIFCPDCDAFLHETLHNCPGCLCK
jgi:hypothetical protein